MTEKDQIQALIEKYKRHIETTHLEDERYKWELVNEFKGRPDTDVKDFYEEIKSMNFSNLVYHLSNAVIRSLVKEKPEELRTLFKYLFDRDKDLTTRIKFFNAETLKLYQAIGGNLGHHQDERAMATYLTFQQPEIHTFYKSSIQVLIGGRIPFI